MLLLLKRVWPKSSGRTSKRKKPEEANLQPHSSDKSLAPLDSAPYVVPPLPHSSDASLPTEVNNDGVEILGPAMIYMPPTATQNEWGSLVAATKSGISLTGSAAMGKLGPVTGLVDIGECEDSYIFRVSLPGTAGDEKNFSCDIQPDGNIFLKGKTTTGEKVVCKDSEVFEMQTQNLCPAGPFTVSFQLPGPVDHQQSFSIFGTDGIFECIVRKAGY